MLGMRLCTLHNLYFYNKMMEEIREAIEEHRYSEYKPLSWPAWQVRRIDKRNCWGNVAAGMKGGNTMAGMGGIILYIIFLGALVYFMAIRPQKKERQKQQELLASVAVGDTILTSSGFYGVIIDMTDDTVIVEFGSNKNCRIPMQKVAIVQVEKPETK